MTRAEAYERAADYVDGLAHDTHTRHVQAATREISKPVREAIADVMRILRESAFRIRAAALPAAEKGTESQ